MSVFFEFVFSVKDKKNWQALSSKVSPEVIFNALFFFLEMKRNSIVVNEYVFSHSHPA